MRKYESPHHEDSITLTHVFFQITVELPLQLCVNTENAAKDQDIIF